MGKLNYVTPHFRACRSLEMQKNDTLYSEITDDIAEHVNEIVAGKYQQAALGTIDENGYPMVTKVIPMFHSEKIYLLLSDLSEHTKNLAKNNNSSIYFAEKEIHKIRSNNPRLTLQGTLKRMVLSKEDPKFQKLLKHYNKIEPGAKMWAMFVDFNFYVFYKKRQLFVEGFGKAFEAKHEETNTS